VKADFADANHNCWASLLGPPGSSDRIGLSDDGESQGSEKRGPASLEDKTEGVDFRGHWLLLFTDKQ